jgi:CBS domain-containing protein
MVMYGRDIVQSDFITLTGDEDVFHTAKLMKEKRHGFAIILSSGGMPQGIVTEWDFLSKVIAEGRNPSQTNVKEIMTPEVTTVSGGDGIDSIASLMAKKGIRRVLVTENGRILGVITASIMLARMKDYIDRISSQIARLQAPPF